ncbi:MAG TPA: NUDIX domain-containing protein [Bacteroidales bacterium]|nr:NUDIX domain-containing protein [Bacteroidales bacterium]
MTKVQFYPVDYTPDTKLTYSVISARSKGKWVFVRHNKRSTFEIPGGHIETGETADQAAARELMEETGALVFSIDCIATYSVFKNGETGWGRLYFAEIEKIGPVPDISEIADVITAETLPEHNTHPDIQPHLFRVAEEVMKTRL